MYQVIIVGGGLAGMMNAHLLAKAGVSCLIIEKKSYPFHKVCGEFISNEVSDFLRSQGLYPEHLGPPQIKRLLISAENGASCQLNLSMGGFGVSRYNLEHHWYRQLLKSGVDFKLNTRVTDITFESGYHLVTTGSNHTYQAPVVIGAYGKRTQLDKRLNRPFIGRRSAYLGVKYHVSYPWDNDLIALHSFREGYCGISMIEQGKVNLCYLSGRNNLRDWGTIDQMERQVLGKNRHLQEILNKSQSLFDKPLVINEISFDPKSPVVNHIFMCGDAAGLITPLCGNGMAMAIHSATLLAPQIVEFLSRGSFTREQLEQQYSRLWRHNFSRRLMMGRYLQKAFFNKSAAQLLIRAAHFPAVANWIVRQTHGKNIAPEL